MNSAKSSSLTFFDEYVLLCFVLSEVDVSDGELIKIFIPLTDGLRVEFLGQVANFVYEIGFAVSFLTLSDAQEGIPRELRRSPPWRSARLVIVQFCDDIDRDLAVVEMELVISHDLVGFVSLSGDYDDVTGLRHRDRTIDRLHVESETAKYWVPVSATPTSISEIIFRGSSVLGLSDVIKTTSLCSPGNSAHRNTLCFIAIAAAAKDRDDAAQV